MPQPRYIDESGRNPDPSGVQEFFSKLSKSYKEREDTDTIGKILQDAEKYEDEGEKFERTVQAVQKSNISPTRRAEFIKETQDTRKVRNEQAKALNARFNKSRLTAEEQDRLYDTLVKSGYPEHTAEQYVNSPPGVQGVLAREHQVLTERGLRSPLVKFPPGLDQQQTPNVEQTSAPQNNQVPDSATSVAEQPKVSPLNKDEWPAPDVPKNRTHEEIAKWEDNNEKENSKALKETTDQKKLLKNNKNRITTMTKINDGKYLPEGLGRLIVTDPSTGEIRPTAQLIKGQNPQTALYVKNLNQYLEGIKAQLGSVITDFDIRTFKSQLPSLLNDEQGRRLILKQMEYSNELESSYIEAHNEALKHYGRDASPAFIQKVAQEKVAEREEKVVEKLNNLVEASEFINIRASNPEKFKGTVLMQRPDGKFRSVPQEKAQYLEKEKNWSLF